MNDQTPVLVGTAQLVQRDVALAEALEPLAMLEQCARAAAHDAELSEKSLAEIDTIGIVDIVAWKPSNGPRLLAERLGAQPGREVLTSTGGEISISLLNDMAERIARGQSQMAFVAGCNNVRTLIKAQKAGEKIDWSQGGGGSPEAFGSDRPGNTEIEKAYGLGMPVDVYPIFENALRAHRGLDLAAHRRRMGELFHPFTKVAAKNPYAWFPVERSADELTAVTPGNRMIVFPYTKYLNAVLETDQAAGVLLLSAGRARELGIPEERWVYWWGGANSQERAWYASERPDHAACPALLAAVGTTLERAACGLDDLQHLDFYSCFPAAVEMACEMLGLADDDPRGLTVTGGLPYAGGPGNNYCLHSVATMVDRLRGAPGERAMVTGNGWYLTKHSAALLSSAPPDHVVADAAVGAVDSQGPDALAVSEVVSGDARIETYTAVFDREGAPVRGIVVGRSEAGARFLANTPEDPGLLADFVSREMIGLRGKVSHEDGRNLFSPA